jgi:hypothetical protein
MARASAHRQETQIAGFAPLGAFLEEVGLMGPIARRLWRRTGFLPATTRGSSAPTSAGKGAEAEADDDVYDGAATLQLADQDHTVRVRLTGHLDPIDGRYHWRGTILDPPTSVGAGPVRLAIESRCVNARITERTAQGGYSIVGIGAPPFTLPNVEVSVVE